MKKEDYYKEIEKEAEKLVLYDEYIGLDEYSIYEKQGFEKGAKWMYNYCMYGSYKAIIKAERKRKLKRFIKKLWKRK